MKIVLWIDDLRDPPNRPGEEYFGGEDKFKQQQLRDSIKRNYCLSHKIPLIEIPYTELYNLNIQQQLQKKGVIV